MLFDAIFLTLFFLTWTLEATVGWVVLGLRRGGHGALWALPFAWLGGAGGGALPPLLGLDDGVGIAVSMLLTAPLGGGLLAWLAFRAWDTSALGERFARFAVAAPTADPAPPNGARRAIAGEQGEASIGSATGSTASPDDPPTPDAPV